MDTTGRICASGGKESRHLRVPHEAGGDLGNEAFLGTQSWLLDRDRKDIIQKDGKVYIYIYTLRQSNVAIENPLKMGVSMGKSAINRVFSIAMFDSPRVYT